MAHLGVLRGLVLAEQKLSIAAMKEAWRTGEWRRDSTWRAVFIMAGGRQMMTVGGFGAAVVAGSPVVKILSGSAWNGRRSLDRSLLQHQLLAAEQVRAQGRDDDLAHQTDARREMPLRRELGHPACLLGHDHEPRHGS